MKKRIRKEKPFPVAGVMVAVGCLVAVGLVAIYLKPSRKTRMAAPKSKKRRKGRVVGIRVSATGERVIVMETGTGSPASAGARAEPRRPAPQAPRAVRFSAQMPSQVFKDWKLLAGCPRCGKELTNWSAQACSCGQPLKWPAEISCPFCSGGGKCSVCKGEETVCKYCKGRSKRAMMGIVLEKCGYCDGSGKCTACKGGAKCPMCEGTGKLVPSKMSR